MNLVEMIQEQLTGEVINKLRSLIGGDEAQIKSAVNAAIPALLSAFSCTASGSGAEKLASTLNAFSAETSEKTAGAGPQNSSQTLEQGNQLLDSLLGSGNLSGLATVLSKFVGLDAGSLKKLLAFVVPAILGAIAKQFSGRPATAQGLKNLFAEQKANIAQALPAGLSTAGIPGLSEIGSAAKSVAATARNTADQARAEASPLMKTLLPVGILALLGFLGWQFFKGPNETEAKNKIVTQNAVDHTVKKPILNAAADSLPDVTKLSDSLTSVFAETTKTLKGVTDADSAEAAIPQLDKLQTQIDGLAALWKKIPAAARTGITKLATDNLGKLTDLIEQVQAIPGVGEKLTPILDRIVTKLKEFEGDQ